MIPTGYERQRALGLPTGGAVMTEVVNLHLATHRNQLTCTEWADQVTAEAARAREQPLLVGMASSITLIDPNDAPPIRWEN